MLDATPPVTTRQVSVAEAARELGISPETVRRRIKSGQLKAERSIRPQGTVWEVSLPVTTPRGVPPVAPVTGPTEASPSEPAHATSAEASHPSPPVTGPTDGSAPLAASIARLIVELAEVRVVSDRRADQLVSMSETIGRQAERVAQLEQECSRLAAALMAARSRESSLTAPGSPTEASGAPQPVIPTMGTPTDPLANVGTVAAARAGPAGGVRGRAAGVGAVMIDRRRAMIALIVAGIVLVIAVLLLVLPDLAALDRP